MIRTKIKKGLKNNAIVIVSGYFNPLHSGHIDYLREAKKLGRKLIVIVNNDEQVKLKGSKPFMTEKERLKIIMAIRYVDVAFISPDKDKSSKQGIISAKKIIPKEAPIVFANGGDRTAENVLEIDLCKELGIEMAYGVGGDKKQSSSNLLKRWI